MKWEEIGRSGVCRITSQRQSVVKAQICNCWRAGEDGCCVIAFIGGVCAPRTTVVLTIPTVTPDIPSPRGAPPSRPEDRKPSLQSMLHKAKWRISTLMCITHVLANKQCVPHKCGHQYIHHNNAPGTHHKM